jgi:hypothetical protein
MGTERTAGMYARYTSRYAYNLKLPSYSTPIASSRSKFASLFDSDGGHQEPLAIFNGRLCSNNGLHGVGDPSFSPSSWIDPNSQAVCSD